MVSRSHIFLLILIALGIYTYHSKVKTTPEKDHIAIIHVRGHCNNINAIQFEYHLYKAITNDKAKAIIVKINSSGGYSMNNFKELLEYSKTKKPTVIYVKNIAASAAYEPIVGMEIFAHETSEIGSIGLWFIQTNFTELHKHLGIKRKIITTNSELEKYANKNHPEYKSFLEEWLKVHAKKTFYNPVLEHRNIDHKHLNGEVWYGEKAKKYNFIDHIISHIDEIKEHLVKEKNIEDTLDYKLYNDNEPIFARNYRPSNIISLIHRIIFKYLI